MKKNGQVIIEFTFCMIIVMLMMYGLIRIFAWTGIDLAQRRMGHDVTLETTVPNHDYTDPADSPLIQLDPFFYKQQKMNAVWDGI